MLTNLTIKNVVLIKYLNLSLKSGFTTLTGETGAGKSILLDSLGLCLGMRAESRLVRAGEDKAQVSAVFSLPKSHPVFEVLENQDIDIEDDLILRRSLTADGRSKAFVNDQPVSLSSLRQIGDTLVEIHGQFESHGLLNPKTHMDVLDNYAGTNDLCVKVAQNFAMWRGAQKDLAQAKQDLEESKQEEEFLKASVEDLEKLGAQTGEEGELTLRKNILLNKASVVDALRKANYLVSGDKGAQDTLGKAWTTLEKVSGKGDERLESLIEAINAAHAEMEETASLISSVLSDVSMEEENLEEIDDRLHDLKSQGRKFGCMPDQLPEKLDELKAKLENIYHCEDVLNRFSQKLEEARKAYMASAQELSAQRHKAGTKLDKAVNTELPPLKLDKAKFQTQLMVKGEEQWGTSGMDDAIFVVSTNPGSTPGPLNKIASGGELSRFMLALKVVLADTGGADTLIFDEIDSGVGGATASAIGERLSRLSSKRQILVVTHSPQVAASAQNHWIISKSPDMEGQIVTQVTPIEEPANRREEIARMLAGSEITTEARAAADKLLENTGA